MDIALQKPWNVEGQLKENEKLGRGGEGDVLLMSLAIYSNLEG